jgi:hypothetical protein
VISLKYHRQGDEPFNSQAHSINWEQVKLGKPLTDHFDNWSIMVLTVYLAFGFSVSLKALITGKNSGAIAPSVAAAASTAASTHSLERSPS